MPVLMGPLRGGRWIFGSGIISAWLGTYEREKQSLLAKKLRPGATLYDVGANVGFYSLLGARLVGRTGHVYAFEPLPDNLEFLRRHVALNRLADRIDVIDKAVSKTAGMMGFEVGDNGYVGRLSEDGQLQVSCTYLDELLDSLRPPDVLKIDVEGAEMDVLLGGERLLRTVRPTIFLATHSPALEQQCCRYLRDLQYNVFRIGDAKDEFVAEPTTSASRR